MAGLAGVDQQRAPGVGHRLGGGEGAVGIVAAGNQDRGEGQGGERMRGETRQLLRPDGRIGVSVTTGTVQTLFQDYLVLTYAAAAGRWLIDEAVPLAAVPTR